MCAWWGCWRSWWGSRWTLQSRHLRAFPRALRPSPGLESAQSALATPAELHLESVDIDGDTTLGAAGFCLGCLWLCLSNLRESDVTLGSGTFTKGASVFKLVRVRSEFARKKRLRARTRHRRDDALLSFETLAVPPTSSGLTELVAIPFLRGDASLDGRWE